MHIPERLQRINGSQLRALCVVAQGFFHGMLDLRTSMADVVPTHSDSSGVTFVNFGTKFAKLQL